ncbi:hypothetical protein ACFLSJ_02455 [Verrucomicrobiota bacterium]
MHQVDMLGRAAEQIESRLPVAPGANGRICLVVEDSLYGGIATKLSRYIQDLEAAGHTVLTYRFVSGSAEDLRAYLTGLFQEPASLAASQLLGDIPYVI